jgi:hypothetical protein
MLFPIFALGHSQRFLAKQALTMTASVYVCATIVLPLVAQK